MPTFTPQQLRAMMAHKNNIRNTTVIAHVDHGKSTLTDTLVRMAGISNTDRYTHGREDERLKGITIKSTGLSLFFELPESVPLPSLSEEGSSSSSGGPSGGRGFLFNLVDTPGHVDFSSEVTAALRVTDGALVVVDCVEGVCVQTETVLRQALAEGIKPVLVLNKLDRVILELQLTPEEAYQALVRTIEDVNTIVATYGGTLFGEGRYRLDPLLGNVTFGSALHGWGFSLPAFARMLARSTDTGAEALLSRLWGENYFDPQTKRWKSSAPPASSTSSEDEKNKPRRGFCKLVLAPIYSMVKAAMASERDTVSQKLSHLGISLRAEDLQKEGKDLMKAVMPKFLSMGDALLEMMVTHLPSPAVAQRYRVELLYEGPMDDACATAIRECDPDGPLMVYISKQVPAMGGGSSDKSRFYSFGRVFSGVVRTGQKVRIMGPDFVHGQTRDLFVDKSVQRTCLIMGRYVEAMEDVPCGNTVCLVGLDKFLVKSGTLTNAPDAHPFRAMKLSVSPVVRVAVRPKKATDIPRLAKGLKLLAKMDTCVQCTIEESTGEMIVAGAGELHLDTVLNDLSSLSGIEITRSDPVVSYRESIRGVASSQACLAKSPNHHNRLWTTAQPMGEDLLKGIEVENTITTYMDPKQRAKILEETYGWPHGEGRRVWSFAPNDFGPNVLVDNTKGVQYMHEIKDSFNSAFQWVAGEGVLCGEPMRGIRFNIVDATLHSDSIHRGGGQIIPAARRALFAAQLSSKPCIQEPIYLVEILTQETAMGGIYKVLSKRRGNVFSVEHREGTPLCMMKAHLPVGESFGFTGELREATGGFAYPQCFFDHWSEAPGDPLVADNGNLANGILMDTRRRKGLPLEVPRLEDFVDKL